VKCHTLRKRALVRACVEDIVRSRSICWIFSLFLLFAIASHAQIPGGKPVPPPTPGSPPLPGGDADEARDHLARDLAKKNNLERQAALKKDTDKLLKLAVELKDSVDKSNENVLSLDVLKKADEIEKLAHSVKDKMKGPN
jgi:hypothetical protein